MIPSDAEQTHQHVLRLLRRTVSFEPKYDQIDRFTKLAPLLVTGGLNLFIQRLLDTSLTLALKRAADPLWGSCSLGVFICLDCSGIHRNIPDVSKVKSLSLSRWEDHEMQ
ncbi:hypothetical protein F2P81_009898, partial [Scophthalmus maximus]